MQTCCSCRSLKDDSFFPLRKNGKRNTKCKECHAIYVKAHYERNKAQYKKRAATQKRNDRAFNKSMLADYLSDKKCVSCGISDSRVLDFDHKNPSEKTASVSSLMRLNTWKVVLNEIQKCQILCSNCHRIKTFEQFGWKK